MPHLLIVEDEPTMSWALAEGLSDEGFTIDTFRSAEDALTWLRSGASDLVITDYRLPGMNGLELARRLRRGRAAQPVIVVTAYAGTDVWRECERAGVAACFSKPFEVEALRRAVARAIENVQPRPTRGSERRAA